MIIAGHNLSERPLLVAEAGVNHNGSVDRAISMVHAAAGAGVDALKWGIFKADEFCRKSDPLYPVFKQSELPDSAWPEIKAACERAGLIFFATPQNPSDLETLLRVGVPCVKVGSDDLTNLTLIERYARTGLPIILSTGMADLVDVQEAVLSVQVNSGNTPLVLACTSEYPCPPRSANLRRITTLRNKLGLPLVGFSDHTVGTLAAVVAAALGACYFEKHFTLDNDLEGPDHRFSADPTAMAYWVLAIRSAFDYLGSGEIKPTHEETINRVHWRRTSGQQLRGTA